jgi:hypothetical protein
MRSRITQTGSTWVWLGFFVALALTVMATAIFVLSRIWRLPLGASIAGSLSSVVVFPPFSYIFGFSTLLSIVPDAAMGAAVMIIAAGISYWVNDVRWKTIVSGALLLALWLGYAVYSNPSWFIGAGFVFAPLLSSAFSTPDLPR